jgi:hypothetical protein
MIHGMGPIRIYMYTYIRISRDIRLLNKIFCGQQCQWHHALNGGGRYKWHCWPVVGCVKDTARQGSISVTFWLDPDPYSEKSGAFISDLNLTIAPSWGSIVRVDPGLTASASYARPLKNHSGAARPGLALRLEDNLWTWGFWRSPWLTRSAKTSPGSEHLRNYVFDGQPIWETMCQAFNFLSWSYNNL